MACPREKREMIERTLVGEFGVKGPAHTGAGVRDTHLLPARR